jgi:hypothetical protein
MFTLTFCLGNVFFWLTFLGVVATEQPRRIQLLVVPDDNDLMVVHESELAKYGKMLEPGTTVETQIPNLKTHRDLKCYSAVIRTWDGHEKKKELK